MLIAAAAESVKLLGTKISINKFWIARRKLYDAGLGPSKDNSVTNANTPSLEAYIATKWFARHAVVLPHAPLLTPTN